MMVVESKASAVALVVGAWAMAMLVPLAARAGIPECSNIRIEADAQCRVEVGVDCEASCSLGVYEKACAAYQYQTCQPSCTVPPQPACTDGCAEECAEQCNVGIDVVCHQNCFPECVDECAAACETADDTIQCRASCESTCDGECDEQCAMLPEDASCYDHCMECCGGSCNAAANMSCQLECQDHTWEQCEYELRVECEASCGLDGALFCDGQLVAAGSDLHACAAALVDRGAELLGLEEEVDALEEELEEDIDGAIDASAPVLACTCRGGGDGRPGGWGTALALLGLLGLRRGPRGRR